MRRITAVALLPLLLARPLSTPLAGTAPLRLLVLPFQLTGSAVSETGSARAAAEMAEVCLSQAEGVTLVDRGGLGRLLEEHRLSLAGLAGEEARVRAGALAGAQVLVGGSLHFDEGGFRIDGRAFDAATGVVTASHSVRGKRGALAEAVHDLCGLLSASLRAEDSPPFSGPVNGNPQAALSFMRGLGLYHAGRYQAALGEFFRAEEEGHPAVEARAWEAKTYLALGEFPHACLELQRLEVTGVPESRAREVEDGLELCRGKMTAEEAALVRGLPGRQ